MNEQEEPDLTGLTREQYDICYEYNTKITQKIESLKSLPSGTRISSTEQWEIRRLEDALWLVEKNGWNWFTNMVLRSRKEGETVW